MFLTPPLRPRARFRPPAHSHIMVAASIGHVGKATIWVAPAGSAILKHLGGDKGRNEPRLPNVCRGAAERPRKAIRSTSGVERRSESIEESVRKSAGNSCACALGRETRSYARCFQRGVVPARA